MKALRLSKTAWLILSAGVFLVVLAGLGVTRNQQLKDEAVVQDELAIAETRLANMDTSGLSARIETLKTEIDLNQAQLDDAVARLDKTVISADVAEELYKIAEFSSVEIMNFTSTPIAQDKLSGVGVSQTGVSARVLGTLGDIVGFIKNVNSTFTTGYIRTASIVIDEPPQTGIDVDAPSEGTITLIIYSYEG